MFFFFKYKKFNETNINKDCDIVQLANPRLNLFTPCRIEVADGIIPNTEDNTVKNNINNNALFKYDTIFLCSNFVVKTNITKRTKTKVVLANSNVNIAITPKIICVKHMLFIMIKQAKIIIISNKEYLKALITDSGITSVKLVLSIISKHT